MSNYDGIKIIGAGTGRTGTTSFKRALEILGYGPCYHMEEVMAGGQSHFKFWTDMAKGDKRNFDEVFKARQYQSTSDFPACMFWKEQLHQYPNAKVILTVRDPEKWLKSCNATIFGTIPDCPLVPWGIRVMAIWLGMREMLKVTIGDLFAHQDWSHDNLIKQYKAHVQQVLDECPKERLLVFDVSDGWTPLCKFLKVPIPKEPFPKVNDTKEFQAWISTLNYAGYGIIGVAIASVSGLLWFGSRFIIKRLK